MKDDILAASTKYQIGGQPGMTPSFVLKSVIGAKRKVRPRSHYNCNRYKKKLFDKESLVDCILSLSEASMNQVLLSLVRAAQEAGAEDQDRGRRDRGGGGGGRGGAGHLRGQPRQPAQHRQRG